MENQRDSSTEKMRQEIERQKQERGDQSMAHNLQQMEVDEIDGFSNEQSAVMDGMKMK